MVIFKTQLYLTLFFKITHPTITSKHTLIVRSWNFDLHQLWDHFTNLSHLNQYKEYISITLKALYLPQSITQKSCDIHKLPLKEESRKNSIGDELEITAYSASTSAQKQTTECHQVSRNCWLSCDITNHYTNLCNFFSLY